MFHEPAQKDTSPDHAIAFKTRLGIVMFFIYGMIYAGFVGLNIFRPSSMEIVVFAGLNLSVVYGFGLIIVAFLMALLYNHFCSFMESKLNKAKSTK